MKYKHKRLLLAWNPFRRLLTWMKHIRFKKRENVSLYRIIKVFLENLRKDQIMDRANGVAFNFILAIFPAIIFLFTLIPYVSNYVPGLNKESILKFLYAMMPASMFEVIKSTVEDILGNTRGGLLTLGFIFSLYLATNGMMALMRAFNSCYRTIEKRGELKMRLIATSLTINLALTLFLTITLLIVGEFILDYIKANVEQFGWTYIDVATEYSLKAVRFVVLFIGFFLAIATIYYFGPAVHFNWRFFSIGSFISTFLFIAVSYGFSYYVTNFGTYNKVYGSIGVLIALMVWVQLITIVLLIGFEINASIHMAIRSQVMVHARRQKRLKK
jgi:membrane protein